MVERQEDWQKAIDAYNAWRELSPSTGTDAVVASAITDFQASWDRLTDDPFDVAFRCRRMVSRVRSLFQVTTIPSMPVD